MGAPPLPYRARPVQVVLAVGAVLVVASGAAALAREGNPVARAMLLVLAAIAAACSAWASSAALRATRETLAACAVGLAVPGSGALGTTGPPGALAALGLSAAFLVLHAFVPAATTWLLAAWATGQLAVLDLLPRIGPALRPEVYLGVTLAGLVLALRAGRLVPRVALVTTAPWEVAGVVTGLHQAWTGAGPARSLAAGLVTAAAGGLVVARLRPALDPLLGPPRVVPVVAGLLTGIALAGALAGAGTAGVVAAGYVGVLLATTVRELLTGWPRGLFGPLSVAGGSVMAALSLGELGSGGSWGALALLFLLTAVPAGVVSVVKADERPAAVPTAVACLAGAVLLAVPAGVVAGPLAAGLLTGLFAAALAAAALLPAGRRTAAQGTAAACAAASVALSTVAGPTAPAVLLGVQSLLTLGWAAWSGWSTGAAARPAWRVGAAELVVASWLPLADRGVHLLEAWTLPLAAGLLVAAGRSLLTGRSWPAFGPGLLVAAVPSAVAAVAEPGTARPVAVLATAAAVMVAAALAKVRAPLLLAAATAVAVALGLAAVALPWPLVAAGVTGLALLAVGARRELIPVAGFGLTLAKLR